MRHALVGGNIFDGTGQEPFKGDVVIEDSKLSEVGAVATKPGDEVVDVTGLTILPGLIDTHVHVGLTTIDLLEALNMPFSYQFFLTQKNLEKTLDAGITTVRDAAGADLGIQKAVDDGLIDGPSLHIAIIALSQTGGHGDHWFPSGNATEILIPHPGRPSGLIDGVDEARKRTRELLRAGANQIKVNTSGGVFSPRDDPRHAQFSDEELAAIVDEATRVGTYVMAHAHGAAGVKTAARAGVRSIEHGTYLDEEAIELMLDRDMWLVPTLGVSQFILDRIDAGDSIPSSIAEKARAQRDIGAESFVSAVEAGVRIAMGSDAAAASHGNNLIELRLMSQMGMRPHAVLEAATRSAAELLGIEDRVGTVAVGKQGDLVLVSGDPFDFDAYPDNIQAVYREGRRVRQSEGWPGTGSGSH